MINAKEELLAHIRHGEDVEYVKIAYSPGYGKAEKRVEGTLEEVLPFLDFKYDNGYGMQELEGYIWYTDGTWSARGVYDGSEWWEHQKRPGQNIKI